MNVLLLVQSYPGANAIVARHWPHYAASGATRIVGIGTTDGGCRWPKGAESVEIGENLYICREHLPRRLIETFRYGLEHPGWDRCAVIEYDTCFFRRLPENLPPGLTTQLTGFQAPGSTCTRFYHNPWIADRDTAERILLCGLEMIAFGDIQGGSPDTFLGRMCEKYSIPTDVTSLQYYSQNCIHPGSQWVQDARRARLAGAHVIHGIKDASVLRDILQN